MRRRTVRVISFLVATALSGSALAGTFDEKKAVGALAMVDTAGCGAPVPKWVDATFDPSGKVTEVSTEPGTFSVETVHCLTERFREATVAPFDGESHVIHYVLGDAPPAAATDDEHDVAPIGHFEKRGRPGLVVAGSIVLAVGALFLIGAVVYSQLPQDDTCKSTATNSCGTDNARKTAGGGRLDALGLRARPSATEGADSSLGGARRRGRGREPHVLDEDARRTKFADATLAHSDRAAPCAALRCAIDACVRSPRTTPSHESTRSAPNVASSSHHANPCRVDV